MYQNLSFARTWCPPSSDLTTLCALAWRAGVDIGALLEKVGIQVNSTSEKVGTVAIAYAAHKALSPVRFPPTVALTPVVARLLGRNTSTTLSPNADSNVDDVKK